MNVLFQLIKLTMRKCQKVAQRRKYKRMRFAFYRASQWAHGHYATRENFSESLTTLSDFPFRDISETQTCQFLDEDVRRCLETATWVHRMIELDRDSIAENSQWCIVHLCERHLKLIG